MNDKASAMVTAVNPSTVAGAKATVDVIMFGRKYTGLRYPSWYTPAVGNSVIVEWLGSQPYVSVAFF